MFGNSKHETVRLRSHKTLQSKYERLKTEYDKLSAEKAAVDSEFEKCKTQLKQVEDIRTELVDSVAQVRHIKEQYNLAYEELKILKRKYSSEFAKLLKQMVEK